MPVSLNQDNIPQSSLLKKAALFGFMTLSLKLSMCKFCSLESLSENSKNKRCGLGES